MQSQLARVLQEVQWLGLRLDPNTEVQASQQLHVVQYQEWYHTDWQCVQHHLPAQVASLQRESVACSIERFLLAVELYAIGKVSCGVCRPSLRS